MSDGYSPGPGGHRWECPYCGDSRVNKASGESGKNYAISALRTHIFASDGAEHGPRNEFPDGESLDLADYVVEVGPDRASSTR